jgi:hypothetical protein
LFGFVLESVSLNLVLERTRLNYASGAIVPKLVMRSCALFGDEVSGLLDWGHIPPHKATTAAGCDAFGIRISAQGQNRRAVEARIR